MGAKKVENHVIFRKYSVFFIFPATVHTQGRIEEHADEAVSMDLGGPLDLGLTSHPKDGACSLHFTLFIEHFTTAPADQSAVQSRNTH